MHGPDVVVVGAAAGGAGCGLRASPRHGRGRPGHGQAARTAAEDSREPSSCTPAAWRSFERMGRRRRGSGRPRPPRRRRGRAGSDVGGLAARLRRARHRHRRGPRRGAGAGQGQWRRPAGAHHTRHGPRDRRVLRRDRGPGPASWPPGTACGPGDGSSSGPTATSATSVTSMPRSRPTSHFSQADAGWPRLRHDPGIGFPPCRSGPRPGCTPPGQPFRMRAFCWSNSAWVSTPADSSSPSCLSWASRSFMSAGCGGAAGACGGGTGSA